MSENSGQIIPMLAYEDGVAAMNWLCDVFGFVEKSRMLDDQGRLAHGELAMGSSVVMLASPTPDYQCPKHHRQVCKEADKWYQVPYIINGVLVLVDDIVQHYQCAKEHGATILTHIETGGPGTRYRAEDLEGQRWMFMQRQTSVDKQT
jgi:PhnB protein